MRVTTEDFVVAKVVKVISICDEFAKISKSYTILLKGLQLVQPDAHVNALKIFEMILQSYPSPTAALEFILSEWSRKYGKKANITELIRVLEKLEYYATADLLWSRFGDISASSNISTSAEPLLVQNQKTTKSADSRDHKDEHNPLLEKSTPPEYEVEGGKMTKIKTHIINTWKTIIFYISGLHSDNEENFMKTSICKFERVCGSLHIFASVIFFAIIFGSGGDYFGSTLMNMLLQLRLDLSNAKVEILHNTVSTVPPGLMNNESYQISVGSYREYQTKMHHIPDYIPVNVSIHLNSPDDWPKDVPLENSGQIKKLTLNGSFDVDKIINILQEAKHIEELHLINSMYGLCHRMEAIRAVNDPGFDYPSTVLSNLRAIHFENFSSCNNIYSFFSTNIITKSLKSFNLINSIIDPSSVPFIQHFLRGHRSSLEQLSFPSTRWSASLFDDGMPEFPKVSEILIDFLTDTGVEYSFFGSRFHDIFPRLAIFTSNQGFPSWTHFTRLLDCKSLSHLKTKLMVPYKTDRVNMNFLRNANAALKFVDILFFFPNKTWTDKCEIEGIESEAKRFNLTVRANCDVCEI